MDKMNKMNELVKKIFESPKHFLLFPFAFVGLLLIGLYYLVLPTYMLAEVFVKDFQAIIYENNDKDSNSSKAIKAFIGFGWVVFFNFIKCCLSIPLALSYVLISIAFYFSSLGKFKAFPFAFSVDEAE